MSPYLAPLKSLHVDNELRRNQFYKIADLVIGDGTCNICLSNHADQVMAINDWQTTHLMFLHCGDRFVNRVICSNSHRFFVAEFACGHHVRIFSGRNAANDDVAVGQHTFQPVIFTTDWHRTNAEIPELRSRLGNGVIDPDALGISGHDFARCYHGSLRQGGGPLTLSTLAVRACRVNRPQAVTRGCEVSEKYLVFQPLTL